MSSTPIYYSNFVAISAPTPTSVLVASSAPSVATSHEPMASSGPLVDSSNEPVARLVPLVANAYPMQTRVKSGITKKKQVLLTKSAPDYLNTEPTSFKISCSIPQWHEAMSSKFAALER